MLLLFALLIVATAGRRSNWINPCACNVVQSVRRFSGTGKGFCHVTAVVSLVRLPFRHCDVTWFHYILTSLKGW